MTLAIEIAVSVLVGIGSLCVLVAALGVVRMPDLFTRMQASSKASTLGAILILVAAAISFGDAAIGFRTLMIAAFLAITTPVGAHMIARSGYAAGSRMADPEAPDALAGRDARDT